MRPLALIAAAIAIAACGRGYANFTLPPLTHNDPNLALAFYPLPDPVLSSVGGWDSHDALNPSVVRRAATLYNFYSGYDGASWRTALATSTDGLTWSSRGAVLSPDPKTWEGGYIAANGSAIFYDNQFWYWYVSGPRGAHQIGLARSGNGASFSKLPAPVLSTGPFESWDERAVADPYVIQIGSDFYMYYLGQDRAEPPRQRIGLARSSDGIHWTKLLGNPVLDIGPAANDFQLGEPSVFRYRGYYWMLYTISNFAQERRLALARSSDGVHWAKLPLAAPVPAAWNSKVLCDPTVLIEDNAIRVWFGGGDAASPDENLHGRIGYGVLQPVSATLAK